MAGPCVWLCVLVSVVTVGATTPATPPQAGTCGPTVSSFLEAVGHLPDILASLNQIQVTLDHLPNQLKSTFIQDMRDVMRESRPRVRPGQIIEEGEPWRPRHCQDLLENGDSGRGVRQVYPYLERPNDPVNVFCDQTVDGGGWLVFLSRFNTIPRENFYRLWIEYQLGFGNLTKEHFMGMEMLHAFTSQSLQELRVDLADYDGVRRWAKYRIFHVGPAEDNYRLTIDGYTGDAGDSMTYNNGAQFSTHDADHDTWSGNCAQSNKGAWWYKYCTQANLNGYQYESDEGPNNKGIFWQHWKGSVYSLQAASMMIRPAV